MHLPAGTRLGAYEIEALLGMGGMGEVYRARDTRLERPVAIKVLPPEVAADPERRSRLQREAKAVSSLNHPHISILHDVGEHEGTHYLVMELIAGETLAHRLARVPGSTGLPLNEALPIAHAIALALAAAHRRNIVHRDLKPANVMLTKSGVKLLDFGLAKLTARDHLPGLATAASTDTALTVTGAVVGTLAYMAPEQLEGRPIDGRTDIFAFGVLIYESLTGKRAFEGASSASVIASILNHQPQAVSQSQPLAPAAIDRLVGKCLAKDPEARWQSATDLADELRWIIEAGGRTAAASPPIRSRAITPGRAALVIAALLAGVAIGGPLWRIAAPRNSEPSPAPLVRFTIQPPASAPLNLETIWRSIAVAADGSGFAYTAGGTSSGGQLMVRDFSEPVARAVAGASVVRDPFMSPDGQWVGFHGDGLQKISVAGGSVVTIVNAGVGASLRGVGPGTTRGASWGDDDQIVFATSDPATGLYRVAATGGEPVMLTTPNAAADEGDHVLPSVLPGGRGVLFTIRGSRDGAAAQVAVLDYATQKYKVVVPGGRSATYVSSGHIVYESAGVLRAAPFDVRTLSVTGDSRLLAERVVVSIDGAANYGISSSGTLVSVSSRPSIARLLVWVDRSTGRATPVPGMPLRPYLSPRLSPDQTRIAVAIEDEGEDIWLWDLTRSTLAQFTTDPGRDSEPKWAPDGQSIVFASSRDARSGLYARTITATSDRRLETGVRTRPVPSAITPDGLRVLFHASDPANNWDLMDLAVNSSGSPRVLLASPAVETFSAISPNGRYIAYSSTFSVVISSNTGRVLNQVFVQAYPDAAGSRWQIASGAAPLWSRDGRELFFIDRQMLKSVSIASEGRPVGLPRTWFDVSQYLTNEGGGYDLTADGTRALMVAREAAGDASTVSAQIVATLNALGSAGTARVK